MFEIIGNVEFLLVLNKFNSILSLALGNKLPKNNYGNRQTGWVRIIHL